MKRLFYFNGLAVILLSGTIARAQNVTVDLHHSPLSELLRAERAGGGQPYKSEMIYSSGVGSLQPVIFRHSENGVPDRLTYYYFQADSSLDYIEHEWDVRFTEENLEKPQSAALKNGLLEKYRLLLTALSARYGRSDNASILPQTVSDSISFSRSDNWKPDDSTGIKLYTNISDLYEKKGNRTILPTYRIRLYLRRLRPAPPAVIPAEDKTAQAFFAALRKEDLKAARSLLSEQVRRNIKDVELRAFREMLPGGELFAMPIKEGSQGLPGFTILQYGSMDSSGKAKAVLVCLMDVTGVMVLTPMQH